MTSDEKNIIFVELDKYIKTYYEKTSVDNAKQAIAEFDEKWSIIDKEYPFVVNPKTLKKLRYGNALEIFSAATCEINNLTEADVNRLSSLINEYDKFQNVKSECGIKRTLFFNLGYCWHKLDSLYDNKAIEAFKKYLYYIISPSSDTTYPSLTAYAFRKCNTFLYQSLINDQLNISSPTTFNDPFDCPIRVLLMLLNKGDEISSLVSQAYRDCLKIACFTRNFKLPYRNERGELKDKEKKHKKDKREFLNELMWAHYADSHRGICIKYKLGAEMSKSMNEDKNIVSYFKDVKYSSQKLSSYSKKDSISLEDAFFLKGKKWEYENELRFLRFNLNGKGEHETIDDIPPQCIEIEAIYFGLECSKKDKETIINIMKSKKSVKFYQMEFDDKHFGQLKPKKINKIKLLQEKFEF